MAIWVLTYKMKKWYYNKGRKWLAPSRLESRGRGLVYKITTIQPPIFLSLFSMWPHVVILIIAFQFQQWYSNTITSAMFIWDIVINRLCFALGKSCPASHDFLIQFNSEHHDKYLHLRPARTYYFAGVQVSWRTSILYHASCSKSELTVYLTPIQRSQSNTRVKSASPSSSLTTGPMTTKKSLGRSSSRTLFYTRWTGIW